MLTIYLDESNFNVEACDNSKHAMRVSASIKPNLIILDLGLPDIDGKEVITIIRQWSQAPILVIVKL